jgi:Protein of unknown function (DUF3108)
MQIRRFLAFTRWKRRLLAAGAILPALVAATCPGKTAEDTTLKATYAISIAGLTVGRVEVVSKFSGNRYTAAIHGSTSGPSRLVSDATASLIGSGLIYGARVLPSSYQMETRENGFETHVDMQMRSGRVVDVVALPPLLKAADRVPITPAHKIDVVDPLSAFIVPNDRPGIPSGHRACARTIRVFDGWTRYDVQLYYKDTKAIDGDASSYAGRIIVCGARFIPVAGHRSTRKAVQTMAANRRLEVWLASVPNTQLLVPYRMLIGTEVGDLVIFATRFTTDSSERRAALE